MVGQNSWGMEGGMFVGQTAEVGRAVCCSFKPLRYDLVVNVQKDACFGLSLTLWTIFQICSQFSKIAIVEKIVKIPFFF